jgi:hypothetical protein
MFNIIRHIHVMHFFPKCPACPLHQPVVFINPKTENICYVENCTNSSVGGVGAA